MGEGGDFIAHERRVAVNVRDALRVTPVRQLIFSAPAGAGSRTIGSSARQANHRRHSAGIRRTGHRTAGGNYHRRRLRRFRSDARYGLQPADPGRHRAGFAPRTTPVALENLLYYLVQLLHHPASAHRVLEAAGPEILSYQQQFTRFMAVSGKHRLLIRSLPHPLDFGVVSQRDYVGPPTIARALIQGLKHDLIADDRALRALIPRR